jgi:aspartyl-tRNA(Asn)/glutamyl-tRNA(Gln) amidotransferase subunit B
LAARDRLAPPAAAGLCVSVAMEWETVIGLEIHAQLATRSKIFSGSSTAYGAVPNAQANLVDLGYPGVLPVLNREAVRMAVKFGLAVGAEVARRSVFARKNYFYPDLPKGYQISQYELPVVARGGIEILLDDGARKRIGVTRAHLEEDAGKSLHEGLGRASGIDLNRAGTPLLEIVSEPDMRSAREAVAYMKKVHTLVRYLEICDGNMQEGSFRCDANVSVRPKGTAALGTRCEIKNVNSFRFVEKAIEHEIARQEALVRAGEDVVQETLHFDPRTETLTPLRSKEEAHDYRYFPEPDLVPVTITQEMLDRAKAALPELPAARAERFERDLGLSPDSAKLLAWRAELGDYFETALRTDGVEPQPLANWVNELVARIDVEDPADSRVEPGALATLVGLVTERKVTQNAAKQVLDKLVAEGGDPAQIVEREGLGAIGGGDTLEPIVQRALDANPDVVEKLREGNMKPIGVIVGFVMRETKGRADGGEVTRIVREKLEL